MKLILPHGYLSQSQIELWTRDKNRYKEIYFKKKYIKLNNYGIKMGGYVAKLLEEGELSNDATIDSVLEILPKYDLMDKEIKVEFKSKDIRFNLLGRPDSLCSKTYAFREYKTGTYPWTQYKADKHFQIYFYQLLIYLKYNITLKEAWLDWMPTTKESDGTVVFNGNIKSFKVELSTKTLIDTMVYVQKIAQEIHNDYKEYLEN
jgi:hypothetical protein